MDRGAWWASVLGVARSRIRLSVFHFASPCAMGFRGGSAVKNPLAMRELQEVHVQSPGWKDPLEEGMATHSSGLAWTEEQGRKKLDTTQVT